MLTCLIYQTVICHIVVLAGGANRQKRRGEVDYKYLAKNTIRSRFILITDNLQENQISLNFDILRLSKPTRNL